MAAMSADSRNGLVRGLTDPRNGDRDNKLSHSCMLTICRCRLANCGCIYCFITFVIDVLGAPSACLARLVVELLRKKYTLKLARNTLVTSENTALLLTK